MQGPRNTPPPWLTTPAFWSVSLLALLPLVWHAAPQLQPDHVEPSPRALTMAAVTLTFEPAFSPMEPEGAYGLPEALQGDLDVLGAHVWDGCTLRPADIDTHGDRPDFHIRTGHVAEDRLAQLLGELNNLDVPGVHLGFYTAPRSLEPLTQWRNLRYLTFEGDHLDDASLRPLADLDNLQMLEMGVRPYEHNRVTDEGLQHLRRLAGLRYLGLHAYEGVQGDGLRYLSGLRNLQELELSYTGVDDAGLAHLSSLSQLRTLSLQHTRVTDDGLQHLDELPNLRTLDLRQTAVTAAAAERLATFPVLERVILHYTKQFDVIEAVRARGLHSDGIGWIRGTVGCEHWPRKDG